MFNHHTGRPYNPDDFAALRVPETWAKYDGVLTWGTGQTLAILDDGCHVDTPEWQTWLPWGRKVVATWNSIDGNDDPRPGPTGYHGTSVGFPSSLNHDGVLGVAYNDFVAQVRCNSIVHMREDESPTIAAALRWVIENRQRYNITAVNLAPVDDRPHAMPLATAIDAELRTLRQAGVWVSAPCGNNEYTTGVSWPACAEDCFAIGAVTPDTGEVHRDRYTNTDILVPAGYTSSSNAYAAAAAVVLREAIAKSGYDWHSDGPTLPDAMMRIFRRTGAEVRDPATGLTFQRMDLLAGVDFVMQGSVPGSREEASRAAPAVTAEKR
jgi:hypothetical protein